MSFANCGLPYHIGGEIPERQQLLLKTPQDFLQRFNIDVRIEHQVLQIEADKKVVHIRNEQTGRFTTRAMTNSCSAPGETLFVLPCQALTSQVSLPCVRCRIWITFWRISTNTG